MKEKKMHFWRFGRPFLCFVGLIVAVGLAVLMNSARASRCYNHDDNDVRVTKRPTCGSTGTRKYYCSKCGTFIRLETIKATGNHSYGSWTTVKNANCTEGGVQRRYCNNCDAFESRNISPWGHNSNGSKTVDPTCTEDGYTVKSCTNCGAIMSRTVRSKLGHSWGDWITDSNPTCQKTGQRHHVCKRCGTGASEVLGKTNHDTKGGTKTVNATCTANGYSVATCSMCHAEQGSKTVIPAPGHSMKGWVVDSSPTCQKTGQRHRTCANCTYGESEVMAKLSHDTKGGTKTVNATCTANGYSVATCSMCHAEQGSKTVIPAPGHSMKGWVVDSSPTCQKTGQRHRTCANCTYGESEVMAKLSHDTKGGTKTVKETCGKDGYTVATCSMCHAEQGSKTVIKANGNHSFGSWIVNKNPTCKEYGSRHHTCSVCGYTASENTKPIAHDQKGGTKTVSATCGKDGYTVATCSMCHGEQGSKTVIPATGNHIWGKWKETTPASCEKTGTKQHACEVCGKTESGTIEALGHLVQGQKKNVAATCVSDGYVVVVCSRCNAEMAERIILPKNDNHNWGAWDVKTASTCEKDGIRVHVCNLCGKNEGETIPKLGHSGQGQLIKVSATCVNDGYQVAKCSRCGAELGKRSVLPANGIHSYGDWIVISPLTCETDGFKFRVCTVCGHREEKAEPRTGHLFEGQIRIVNGRYVLVCTNCGKECSEITFYNGASKPVSTGGVFQPPSITVADAPFAGSLWDFESGFGFWADNERSFRWKVSPDGGDAKIIIGGYQGQLHYNIVGNSEAGTGWVTVQFEDADNNQTVVSIYVSANGSAKDRSAKVLVFDDWGQGFIVSVSQYARSIYAVEEPGDPDNSQGIATYQDTELIIDPSQMTISSEEFVGEVNVLNAVGASILVEYEDNTKDWITLKRVWDDDTNSFTDTFTVTVKENQYYTGRKGRIRFTDTVTGKYGWLVINQDYAPNPYTKEPEPGGTGTFPIVGSSVSGDSEAPYYGSFPDKNVFVLNPAGGTIVLELPEGETIEGELNFEILDGSISEDQIQVTYCDNKIIVSVRGGGNYNRSIESAVYIYDDKRGVTICVVVEPYPGTEVPENVENVNGSEEGNNGSGDGTNSSGDGNNGDAEQFFKDGIRGTASKVGKAAQKALESLRTE